MSESYRSMETITGGSDGGASAPVDASSPVICGSRNATAIPGCRRLKHRVGPAPWMAAQLSAYIPRTLMSYVHRYTSRVVRSDPRDSAYRVQVLALTNAAGEGRERVRDEMRDPYEWKGFRRTTSACEWITRLIEGVPRRINKRSPVYIERVIASPTFARPAAAAAARLATRAWQRSPGRSRAFRDRKIRCEGV